MGGKETSLDPLGYFLYAGESGPDWDGIVGQPVTHAKLGRGRVVRVKQRDDGLPIVYVRFVGEALGQQEKGFLTTSFGDGVFTEVVLPDELAARVERDVQRREAEELRLIQEEREHTHQLTLETDARRHFASLRKKYHVGEHQGESPISPLYRILLLLEEDGALTDEDIEWLGSRRLFTVLAMMYQGRYEKGRDLWDLVKASSKWQDAGDHQRALMITEGTTSTDPKLVGAILTTRGRAQRNLRDLDGAEECAREAIALNPTSFYAYNLLGAIYYQLGYPEDGDEQFEKALELGASERGMDGEIRAAVRIAGRKQQRDVAKFLLGKDPHRYEWAKHYL